MSLRLSPADQDAYDAAMSRVRQAYALAMQAEDLAEARARLGTLSTATLSAIALSREIEDATRRAAMKEHDRAVHA